MALGVAACAGSKIPPEATPLDERSFDDWQGGEATPATVEPDEPLVRWKDAALLDDLESIETSGHSEHLGGGYLREVRVNQAATGYSQLIAGERLPLGALVAQYHRTAPDKPVEAIYVMRSTGEKWEFFVLDGKRNLETRGSSKLCVRCHLDAPFGSLFGPTPQTLQGSGASMTAMPWVASLGP
ncbi:hypothetical protein JYT22_00910 [Endomicrobium sp. AH-315-J14]|nr:hypothetical protein [Endomicrobium sp. AH-315-J14]